MNKIIINSVREKFPSLFIRKFSCTNLVGYVDKKDVESIERQALVDFSTEAGIARLEKSIQFANKLMEVNTEAVEPLISTVSERNENVRNDAVIEDFNRKELLRVAPEVEEFYYVAPLGTFSKLKHEPSK